MLFLVLNFSFLFFFFLNTLFFLCYFCIFFSLLPFTSVKLISLSLLFGELNIVSFSVIIISLQIFFYSSYYMKEDSLFSYFFFILLIFILSMLILLLSNSIFFLFLGWDGLGVSSFFLIMFYSNWKSLNNSMITILSNRFGDGLMMILFCFFLFITPTSISVLVFVPTMLLLMTALTKSAQFPFSSWLPAAMAAPTPISALVHSSTLVAAGIALILKFFFFFFKHSII